MTTLDKRSGSAFIWTGNQCDGIQIAGFENVGCGGECHVITGPGTIRYAGSADLYVRESPSTSSTPSLHPIPCPYPSVNHSLSSSGLFLLTQPI